MVPPRLGQSGYLRAIRRAAVFAAVIGLSLLLWWAIAKALLDIGSLRLPAPF